MHVTLGAAASADLVLSHLSYGQLEDCGQVFMYLRLLSLPPLNEVINFQDLFKLKIPTPLSIYSCLVLNLTFFFFVVMLGSKLAKIIREALRV